MSTMQAAIDEVRRARDLLPKKSVTKKQPPSIKESKAIEALATHIVENQIEKKIQDGDFATSSYKNEIVFVIDIRLGKNTADVLNFDLKNSDAIVDCINEFFCLRKEEISNAIASEIKENVDDNTNISISFSKFSSISWQIEIRLII